MTTSLIIGDIHFTSNLYSTGQEFIQKVIEIAEKHNPTFIVLLGDILSNFEWCHILSYQLVEKLFVNLSKISPLYVLVGNHDLLNNSQFLTPNHFFGPFKQFQNITIVDTALSVDIKDKNFTFVPYVPPGRFIEALNTLKDTWELTDCIFAHQEFRECHLGNGKTSNKGDLYEENLPPIISGHMHIPHNIGDNIMYPGSSMQANNAETSKKYIWFVKWEENGPEITKLNLGMKGKKLINMTVDELTKSDNPKFLKSLNKSFITIKLHGSSQEISNFRRSKFYEKLDKLNVKFDFAPLHEPLPIIEKETKKLSYCKVFEEIVNTKDEYTKKEYELLFDSSCSKESIKEDENSGVELVFVED